MNIFIQKEAIKDQCYQIFKEKNLKTEKSYSIFFSSIVMNREEKEDEEEVAEESLAEGSHKSPSSKKSNRSDSLNHTPRLNNQPRISRNNSQSSSLLNNTNRMSLVETGGAIAGPDGLPLRTTTNVRNSTSGNPTAASSASNTLKRSGTLTRNNQVLILTYLVVSNIGAPLFGPKMCIMV